ncbi:MAG: hypothetical protein ACTS3R_20745 [Inquilinaceae bacterium]
MPFLGVGLHILAAIFFGVHVVRTNQPMYWLFVLFSFPLLGSAVYFLIVYLPDSRLEHEARKAIAAAAKSLDPTRELREAQAAFDDTPTAQNRMRLASALLETGAADAAATHYEACLNGPFAADPEIRFHAARAFVESGRQARAIVHLEDIRADDPNFRAEQVQLLIARALAETGRHVEARSEYEAAVNRFRSFEAHVEYALWTLATGDRATAAALQTEIDRIMRRWNRYARDLNKHHVQRLAAARAAADKMA